MEIDRERVPTLYGHDAHKNNTHIKLGPLKTTGSDLVLVCS